MSFVTIGVIKVILYLTALMIFSTFSTLPSDLHTIRKRFCSKNFIKWLYFLENRPSESSILIRGCKYLSLPIPTFVTRFDIRCKKSEINVANSYDGWQDDRMTRLVTVTEFTIYIPPTPPPPPLSLRPDVDHGLRLSPRGHWYRQNLRVRMDTVHITAD